MQLRSDSHEHHLSSGLLCWRCGKLGAAPQICPPVHHHSCAEEAAPQQRCLIAVVRVLVLVKGCALKGCVAQKKKVIKGQQMLDGGIH